MTALLPPTLTNPKQGTKELGLAVLATHHTGFLIQWFSTSLQEHQKKCISSINMLQQCLLWSFHHAKLRMFYIRCMQSEQASKRNSYLTIQENNYKADRRAKNEYSMILLIVWCNGKIRRSIITSRGPNKVYRTRQGSRTSEWWGMVLYLLQFTSA